MTSLQNYLAAHCQKELNKTVYRIKPVSGGDINQAFLLQTSGGEFFVKYQKSTQALAMLQTEANALRVLAQARVIRIPEVVAVASLEREDAMLLMEYISPGRATPEQMRLFGRQLARLHQQTQPEYGWSEDNFIGTLPQKNRSQTTAAAFLLSERLLPQWEMAQKCGYFSNTEERSFHNLLQRLPAIIPEEKPALLHGDLWSGNYLIDENGQAVLIDPASSYGMREMDIAMSRLFGHFGQTFYQGYEEEWPLSQNYAARESIYQLYYLLVHVNLFGQSYTASVRRVLNPYRSV